MNNYQDILINKLNFASSSTNISTMSREQKVKTLHKEITDYLNSCGYNLITDIKTITSKSQLIEYTCKCEEVKKKMFKDLIRRGCKTCNSIKSKEIPEDFSVCPKNNPDEIWKPIQGGFISNLGNAINVEGKEMTLDTTGRYTIGGVHQYATILMANAFKIEGYEKIGGQKNNFVVRSKSETLKPTLNDIYIGTRNEVGSENGKKSKQSEEFKEARERDIIEHTLKFEHRKIEELPDHIIFEDGSIYNNQKKNGKFFLTFSINDFEKAKSYYHFCKKDKTYKVHKLVCMAFHPIEGKVKYDDYSKIQVNHIDGNTLNNHASNLEWVTASENIQHAYENGHNDKVRTVVKFVNNGGEYGEKIEEFKSLAEAARMCKIPEHEIRQICKGKGKLTNKKWLWKYKNDEETHVFSKKFSSRLKNNNVIYFDDEKE